jgi:hypothetical protein
MYIRPNKNTHVSANHTYHNIQYLTIYFDNNSVHKAK